MAKVTKLANSLVCVLLWVGFLMVVRKIDEKNTLLKRFFSFFSDSFEASPPKEGVFETCCLHWEDIPTQAINILWSGSWNGRRGPFIRKGLLTTDLGRFLRRFGFCLIFGNIQSFILTVSFRYWCSTRDPGYLTRSGYFSLDSAKVERSSQSQSGPAMSLEDQVSYFNIN